MFILSRRSIGAAGLTAVAVAAGAVATPAASARTVLSSGHVDAVAARIAGGRLVATLKDSTKGATVWRDPASVTIRVVPRARTTIPGGSVLGRRGGTAWLIPQVQRSGIIWTGWNTEEVSSRQVRGPIRWTVRSISGPGRLVVFQTGTFGSADVLFDSSRRMPQARAIALGTHAHGNWAFTKRGTYRLAYTLSGRTPSGATVSDSSTLTFSVG
ncbi:choice-of-anchor M domain-containing protein [Conexibacter sp. JD483]|uniref:choice-of-anchor M domain-containing protein n=1 Tax=unclassified Conexibacter TaxID=2627773 RepID=UPI00272843A9|nr:MULTISPECIES: choice-of-anchor M domain-containing protein [unclassified Conexibacter]MDO8183958.1 choice-of-anchor M domain-containing protein [Conexibacter sp. CPCC 205706]MDO8196950.1 choice-of-anchor M domain-containing protein [Conexibacter sp. CPCC 205762]MDR9369080.1 choice-of-anchor M domain-containing protein [Conexibacter sp. JD483]